MSVSESSLISHPSFAALPSELIDALNQTYFLHLLVNEPQKLIPPGKSLLSMMTLANFKASDGDKPNKDRKVQIAARVKEAAHQAFWNEALESLSSPQPSVQLSRLKRLYFDLYEALSPLFPPTHAILVTLSSPLPPTSSPLHSMISTLSEILIALRQRCAPIRDKTIDDLLDSLSLLPEPVHPIHTNVSSDLGNSRPTPLAEFVIEKTREILKLAEDMKEDLNSFVLGSMTDAQLQSLLSKDVKMRERELVLQIWGGKEAVRGHWRTWVAELPSADAIAFEERWISRLFLALESDKAVCCLLPSHFPVQAQKPNHHGAVTESQGTELAQLNQLPPQLFFSTPALLYIQNYIQAIVIAAALRSLTRLIPTAGSPKTSVTTESHRSEFMSRIWALLKTEVDQSVNSHGGGVETNAISPTKLINLADEVVSARRRASNASLVDHEEEKRLRAAVEHTLRYEDPVFTLLKKRLIGVLKNRVLSIFQHNERLMIPTRMQTGKDPVSEREGKRPRLLLPESVSSSSAAMEGTMNLKGIVVPGFEDKVLQDSIGEVMQKIASCITWVEGTWGDLV